MAGALNLPKSKKDYFRDDKGSKHEANINRLAKAGLAISCGTKRFCPNQTLSRGQLAAFVSRVLDSSKSPKDYFRDDNGSKYESSINRIARAGLTAVARRIATARVGRDARPDGRLPAPHVRLLTTTRATRRS